MTTKNKVGGRADEEEVGVTSSGNCVQRSVTWQSAEKKSVAFRFARSSDLTQRGSRAMICLSYICWQRGAAIPDMKS